jgi:uncharacterized cupredoxin-like copper-binding protein
MNQGITKCAGALLALLLCLTSGLAVSAASAMENEIKVELLDPSVGISIKGMAIDAHPSTIHSGKVTFNVTNRSRTLTHELVLVRLDYTNRRLPYDRNADQVNEEEIIRIGEVPDLPPGGHGSLTATVPPGRYMLICNEPGHYNAGMHMAVTVEP